jgi:chitin synthase
MDALYSVYAFANLHDFSWGTKSQSAIQTDLGVATVGADKTVDVTLPTAQKDIG